MSVIFTKTFTNQVAIAASSKWSPTSSELTERELDKYGPFNEFEITNNSVLDDVKLQVLSESNTGEELILGGTTKVFKPQDGIFIGRPVIANDDSATEIAIGEIKVTLRKVV